VTMEERICERDEF